MTFTLHHLNVQQPDPQSHRLKSISIAAAGAEVVAFNEAGKDHAAIHALLQFEDHTVSENSVAWRPDRFVLVAKGQRTVMLGGRRGTGAPGDKRRRGPSRLVVWVIIEERASDHSVIIAEYHGPAKIDTSAKWRRLLSNAALALAGLEVALAMRKHGVTNAVFMGDLNRIPKLTIRGLTEVPTPATFGRLRYDRLFRGGGAKVSAVTTFTTHSDHKGLSARVTLGDASAAPAPVPPGPVSPPPKGRPPSPWRRFTRRWRRRHPRRWRRIVRRWRRNHRRN